MYFSLCTLYKLFTGTCNVVWIMFFSAMMQSGGQGKFSFAGTACSGRLLCDVKISAKELIRCRSYDLTELASFILKEKRVEVDVDQIRSLFR